MRSLAVAFPDEVRTNDYWRVLHPALVAGSAQKSQEIKVWSQEQAGREAPGLFDAEMAPYLGDPFRGTVERRILAPGEGAIDLELRAARDAIEAAGLRPEDIGALICTSFLADQIGVGNATFLAGRLGLQGAAWNLETACTGALVAYQNACALVHTEQFRHVLVVVSCTYSRVNDFDDTLSFTVGDGAGAFVVSPQGGDAGLVAQQTEHTAGTCGALFYEVLWRDGAPLIRMRAQKHAGRVIRDASERYVRSLCAGAVERAGLRLSDIDFFVFNTPTAWYASFCAKALGIDPARTIDTYPRYANMGAALLTANLYHALAEGRIQPGQLVLLYSVGSVSSASCAIVRMGEVSLGPRPAPGSGGDLPLPQVTD